MSQLYFSLVTNQGRNKLAASAAGGSAITITHFAIGDGNGAEVNPTAANTALVREVWRTPVDSIEIDPDNPSAVLVTAIIPTNAGGFWMREFGIFDASGEMIAVAKPVSQYKPTALEGQLEDIRYEFQIVVGDIANVTLLVDPSVLLASREWVESRKTPINRLAATPWLALKSMSVTAPPANAQSGDLYLVPAGATGAWAGRGGQLAEYVSNGWIFIEAPNGHGISLPDGRVFERVGGAYIEKIALDAQSGKWNYAVANGTANALTATLDPAPAVLARGAIVLLKIAAANTAAVTLNLNGTDAKPVVNDDGSALSASAFSSGSIVQLIYDQTRWLYQSAQRGKLLGNRVYSVAGTYVYTPTPGTKLVDVQVQGGGGAGGGSTYAAMPQISTGGGGGGGGYASSLLVINPATSVSVTVGAGGAANLGATGGNGGTSSFGAHLSATGGFGGFTTPAANAPFYTFGGNGGQGYGGDINSTGGVGNTHNAFAANVASDGHGAMSFFGGGGHRGGIAIDGQAATAPVAGGGGAGSSSGNEAARRGGRGGDGIVIIREYAL